MSLVFSEVYSVLVCKTFTQDLSEIVWGYLREYSKLQIVWLHLDNDFLQ